MVRVGIVGISGYSGYTALRLLLEHPQIRVTYVSANTTIGPLSEIWPQFRGRTKLLCETFSAEKAGNLCDVVFLAVPHHTSMQITPLLLKKGLRVIDLSGDYRLSTAAVYKKWYGKRHTDSRRLGKAVYGLPEIYRARIAGADLVANPGCYPTAAILGLAPLVGLQNQSVRSVIIDAKSGTSGAGKKMSDSLMFCEVNENLKAYKLLAHQHTPEIEQYLSSIAGETVKVTFTPHLVPMNIGIYETIYVQMSPEFSRSDLHGLYRAFYKTEPCVRVLKSGAVPEVKHVLNTNFCDIGLAYDGARHLAIIMVAIDNLMKGAAGQAVQNMNIMCGFPETEGLF